MWSNPRAFSLFISIMAFLTSSSDTLILVPFIIGGGEWSYAYYVSAQFLYSSVISYFLVRNFISSISDNQIIYITIKK